MNTSFLAIIKRITAEQGESILADPKKLKAFVSDYAKDEPKEDRVAFGRAIELGAYNELKRAAPANRASVKAALVPRLQVVTNYDVASCCAAVDLIEAVIYGTVSSAPAQQTSAPTPSPAPVNTTQTTPQVKEMFCSNCVAKLNYGARFCPSCGNPTNSVPAAAVQAEQSNGNSQIIKQGDLSYDKTVITPYKGIATLYNDRLEWKGTKGMVVVIHISEILKTEISIVKQCLTIHLVNGQKYAFSKPITGGDIAKQLAFGVLGTGGVIAVLTEWKSAIDMARGGS